MENFYALLSIIAYLIVIAAYSILLVVVAVTLTPFILVFNYKKFESFLHIITDHLPKL